MTNEQLAEKIKNGNRKYITELWEQLEKFITLKACQYYRLHTEKCEQRGVTVSDLLQVGFFALLEALEAYEVGGEYKFITMLNYPLLNNFQTLLGFRGGNGKDPLNNCNSLDIAPGEDSEDTFKDFIPDERALEAFEVSTKSTDNTILREDLEEAIDTLTNRQAKIVRGMYFHGIPLKEYAERFGVSYSMITQERRDALRKLRHNKKLKEYYSDIINVHGYRGTLSGFKRTGTSSTEYTALKLLDSERAALRNPTKAVINV